MSLLNLTKSRQSELAAYCRDRGPAPDTGVHPDHVKHYRRLVFNVVRESLTAAYPLTVALLEDEEWETLIQEFFREHNCISAQVWKMPAELIDYLQERDHSLKDKYPQLEELLLFEWLEIEVYMMEDLPVKYTTTGNPLKDALVLNPEHRLLQLSYPVHLKNAGAINETDKGKYFVLLFRQPKSYNVQFISIQPIHIQALALLSEKPMNIDELAIAIIGTADTNKKEAFKQSLHSFIKTSIDKGLIPGYVN